MKQKLLKEKQYVNAMSKMLGVLKGETHCEKL